MAYFVKNNQILTDRLEVNIVDHCNLSCRSCNHLSPVTPKWVEDDSVTLEKTLTTLARGVRAKFVYLIGGEPLLHPNLISVLEAVKNSGLGERVAIITNGIFLKNLPEEALDYLSRIEVSVYPGNEPDMSYVKELAAKCELRGVQLLAQEISFFREAFAELPAGQPQTPTRIYRACNIAHMWGILFVHKDHIYKCARAHFLGRRFPAKQGASRSNGVRIHEGESLFGELRSYLFDLDSVDPLPSCQHCLGTVGKVVGHTQLPRKEWFVPHQKRIEELLDEEFLLEAEKIGLSKENQLYEARTVIATANLKNWDSFPYLEKMDKAGLTKNFYQNLKTLADGSLELG